MEITDRQYKAIVRLAQDMQDAADCLQATRQGWRVRIKECNQARAAVTRILKAFPELAQPQADRDSA